MTEEANQEKALSASQLSATIQSVAVGWIARDGQFAKECLRRKELFRSFTNHTHTSIIKGIFELIELNGKWTVTDLRHSFDQWWADDPARCEKTVTEVTRCMRAAQDMPLSKLKSEMAVLIQGTAVHGFVVDVKGKFASKLSDADRMISNIGELKDIKESVEKLHEQLQDPSFKSHDYDVTTVEERMQVLKSDRELRYFALENSVPFLSPVFDGEFALSKGLILIGGSSGTGKSTTLANILAYFIEKTDQLALVISNEETAEGVWARIACCLIDEPFHEYINRKMSAEKEAKVDKCIAEVVLPRVDVQSGRANGMDKFERVRDVLERTAEKDRPVGMVLIDYYQTVQYSEDDPKKKPVDVLKDFGFYLKDFAIRAAVPVVTFAQIKPQGNEEAAFSDRVQNDRTVYNHAQDVIEIIPNFKDHTTKFQFHKGRFLKNQNLIRTLRWNHGRYVQDGFLQSDGPETDEDVVKG